MSDRIVYGKGKWKTECIPVDGGRISLLQFNGINLLTTEPGKFSAPPVDQGEYEKRPVYGYDDCYPSVNPCKHPISGLNIRDHGQLCWQPWQVEVDDNGLDCHTICLETGVIFSRQLHFSDNVLTWRYKIRNLENIPKDFLHVVHPLLPVSEIEDVKIAPFECTYGLNKNDKIDHSGHIGNFLINIPRQQFRMFFLAGVQSGSVDITYKQGLKLAIRYDHRLFPNLGVWWNNYGYPLPEGHFRGECAFEPVPGKNSNLCDSISDSTCQQVAPGGEFSWEMRWEITL